MNLVGTYELTSGERDGRVLPPERVQHTTVTFTDSDVTVANRDRGDIYKAKYVIVPGTDPCHITMTATAAPDSGDVVEGLIDRNQNTVRLIYALPGKGKPTGFKTGPGELLFIMAAQKA